MRPSTLRDIFQGKTNKNSPSQVASVKITRRKIASIARKTLINHSTAKEGEESNNSWLSLFFRLGAIRRGAKKKSNPIGQVGKAHPTRLESKTHYESFTCESLQNIPSSLIWWPPQDHRCVCQASCVKEIDPLPRYAIGQSGLVWLEWA